MDWEEWSRGSDWYLEWKERRKEEEEDEWKKKPEQFGHY